MLPSFSPSINLVRDVEEELHYIPTANAKRIYGQILNDFHTGIHSFNIIGSYGTGKSAFLVAFARTLTGTHAYFPSPNGHFDGIQEFEFLNFVGSYRSIVDVFAEHLDVSTEQEFFAALETRYAQASASNRCLVIVIDEFGKFLEYAAHTNPERELYFVQQLAEFANAPQHNVLFLTTLHQGFFSYAQGLTQTQREEWEKVKGRLKELTFNEPVEQLLELAANHVSQLETKADPKQLGLLLQVIEDAAVFPYRGKLTTDFAQNLFPVDLLAAAVITQSLQRYGQNERSLFTFLNDTDYLGIQQYDTVEHPYYNLVCVYNYLIQNFYALLSSVHNPHYAQWGAMRSAIERVEATVEERIFDALKFVKVIGLLNIFAPDGARISEYFLTSYARIALNMEAPETVLGELEALKIVRYVRFKDSFVLFEGTDLNIEYALVEAAEQIDPINNVVPYLRKYFDFPLLFAKAASYKTGSPRFFEFVLSEEPVDLVPEEITDGYVNVVFSTTLTVEILQEHAATHQPAILYGLYRHTGHLREILFEIEKINYVRALNRDDRVAIRELDKLRAYQVEELNRITLQSLYRGADYIVWIWRGQQLEIGDVTGFNMQLSRICETVYNEAPIYRNELVNRHRLSSSINSARSTFFKALTSHWQEEDLGFPSNKFPPERTIYLTLLKQTGIHRPLDSSSDDDSDNVKSYFLDAPTDPSFAPLWHACESFLEQAKITPRHLLQLVELLSARPFKLKQGFLEFWLPTFLFIQRERFALFYEGRFVPELSAENLELIRREPSKFQVKAFSVDGIKLAFFNRYRALVQEKAITHLTTNGLVETIRPFVTFYASLPEYAKQTERLEPSTIRLRKAIATATDPEKTFFQDLPTALGYPDLIEGEPDENRALDESRLTRYIQELQGGIRELQGCFDALLDRTEDHLLNVLGLTDLLFPDYKTDIAKRYTSLRTHLLLPKQKTLHMRLMSALEERNAWLESIVQAVLGKNMRQMRDEDELVLYDKLRDGLQALDNLCELSEIATDEQADVSAVRVEITTTSAGSQTLLHRSPIQKEAAVTALVEKLRARLTDDQSVNISALTKLLQEIMGNHE